MFEFIDASKKFNFTSKYKYTVVVSLLLLIVALVMLGKGLNYGVDFRGGAEIQIHMDTEVPLDDLRSELKQGGFPGAQVQQFGEITEHQYLVRVLAEEENLNQVTEGIQILLAKSFAEQGARVDKVDIVGPKAGEQLRISGFQAMLWALVAIMVYIGLRFDFKYSPGAIAALVHDVLIIIGIFGVLQLEFTLQIVAALLAVIGYSVNDTVVIYDRVREHEEKFAGKPLEEHINNAISETLSRTLLTSGTTLFISLAMYFFGGQSIKDFFFAITLGVFVGTYSSVFVAAPVTLFFHNRMQAKEA